MLEEEDSEQKFFLAMMFTDQQCSTKWERANQICSHMTELHRVACRFKTLSCTKVAAKLQN